MTAPAERERVVAAAGGVVWRLAGGVRTGGTGGSMGGGAGGRAAGMEVVVVHRPRYDDWSLPKGKLDAGEDPLSAAVREVDEETGLAVVVGRRGLQVRYPVREGVKRVDYWLMRLAGGRFEPNDEVDRLRWLGLDDAAALLTHEPDRAVLADAARTDVPREPTLLLVRHASAVDKPDFDGPDPLRPLDRRGQEQARRLAEVLPAFAPAAVLAAARVRCQETVAPLAERLVLPVLPLPELGEEEFAADPQAGLAAVDRLLRGADNLGTSVACSQGGAIPSILLARGVRREGTRGPYPPAAKGSVWALGAGPAGLLADYYPAFDPEPAGVRGSQAGRAAS